jgi:hypothetical protein
MPRTNPPEQTGASMTNDLFARTSRGEDYSHEDKTPFENFEDLTVKLLKVPKEEVVEKMAKRREARRREED